MRIVVNNYEKVNIYVSNSLDINFNEIIKISKRLLLKVFLLRQIPEKKIKINGRIYVIFLC